ncbi:TPA: hypothetical protein VAK56_004691 [Klebsiella aerogenes]|nr:hypothetical protein [Klebsiella aerogenes]
MNTPGMAERHRRIVIPARRVPAISAGTVKAARPFRSQQALLLTLTFAIRP